MNDSPEDSSVTALKERSESGERIVYVMPETMAEQADDDSIDLAQLWNVLWQSKWLIVGITTIFAIASIAYALSLTHWYRSEVLLAPADRESANVGISSQLGSLAGLAGLSLGSSGDTVEALAILRSRDFTRGFVEEHDLLPILFADKWDTGNQRWLEEDPELWPDLGDGARYFGGNLRSVEESRETGLVTVAVEWKDPELAARWVESLVDRLNDHMRSQALQQASANVDYLQQQLSTTSVVPLQQAVGRLLEREHQKLMLARGNEEFAFRIIDSAEVPETPSRPNRRLMVIVATLFGGLVSVFFVLARSLVRRAQHSSDTGSDAAA